MSPPPTIRSIAQELGLSVATVSEALRGNPRVNPQTRERVRAAAAKAGYNLNPLLGAALSAVRRQKHLHYRGCLALIEAAGEVCADNRVFHREIVTGAQQRAAELGFTTELFLVGETPGAVTASRLQQVLAARGIAGMVLLPRGDAGELGGFDFSAFSAVQMDNSASQPRLHSVVPDHYAGVIQAFERLHALGYERIGLCVEQGADDRVLNKWSAGYFAFVRKWLSAGSVKPALVPQITPKKLRAWYLEQRPDVVVTNLPVVAEWLAMLGAGVPDEAGVFVLNHTEAGGALAGLDLQPRLLGATAIDLVVAQMHRYERGLPTYPRTTTLAAQWSWGASLRKTAPLTGELATG
jgi:LacI family transcriptional regulator